MYLQHFYIYPLITSVNIKYTAFLLSHSTY